MCAEPHLIDRCPNLAGESKFYNCIKKFGNVWKVKHSALSMVCYCRREAMECMVNENASL